MSGLRERFLVDRIFRRQSVAVERNPSSQIVPVAVSLPGEKPEAIVRFSSSQKFEQDWESFKQQPETLRIETGMRAAATEREMLDRRLMVLAEEERSAWEDKDLLSQKLIQFHRSRTEIAEIVERKNDLVRQIARIAKELKELESAGPSRLSILERKEEDLRDALRLRVEEWAVSGDEYRVLRYVAENLVENVQARDILFERFAGGDQTKRRTLDSKYRRLADQPVLGKTIDGNKSPESNRDGKNTQRRETSSSGALADVSLVSGIDPLRERRYSKPTNFEIVLGVNQKPKVVANAEDLSKVFRQVHSLGNIGYEDVWGILQKISASEPEHFSSLERVHHGPFVGWMKYRMGLQWLVIFRIDRGTLTFRVGSHTEIYGTRKHPT